MKSSVENSHTTENVKDFQDPDDILQSDMLARLKKLSLQLPDEEWLLLHAWALEYRRQNKLTVSDFMEVFGIEKTSTFVQYLSVGGAKRKVSKKDGSVGLQLREKLVEARETCSSISLHSLKEKSTTEKIKNIVEENTIELSSKGILSVFPFDERYINIFADRTIRQDQSLDTLHEDLITVLGEIVRPFTISNVKWCEPCSYFSPLCLSNATATKVGTGTIVSVNDQTFVLTARHVVNNIDDETIYCKNSQSFSSQKICRNSRQSPFGISIEEFWHTTCDVAVIVPSANIIPLLNANITNHIGVYSFCSYCREMKEHFSSNYESYVLAKNGISTGVTTGKIDFAKAELNSLICVSGLEYGPVAYYGDSGSLWIVIRCNNPEYIGKAFGVTSQICANITEPTRVEVLVTPVWL